MPYSRQGKALKEVMFELRLEWQEALPMHTFAGGIMPAKALRQPQAQCVQRAEGSPILHPFEALPRALAWHTTGLYQRGLGISVDMFKLLSTSLTAISLAIQMVNLTVYNGHNQAENTPFKKKKKGGRELSLFPFPCMQCLFHRLPHIIQCFCDGECMSLYIYPNPWSG